METVVLLHCSGSSGSQWRALAAQLAGRYRVIAPNLGSAATLAEVAAAVRNLVGAPGEPFHLVGHSYGGGLALHLARMRPELLLSLTLIEPSAFHLLDDGAALHEITAVAAEVRAALAAGDDAGGYGRFVDYWTGAGSWAQMAPEKRAAFAPQLGKVVLEFQSLFNEPAGIEDLREIEAPTLLIQGERTTLPSRSICARVRAALPDAGLRIVQGAGHMSPITHRDAVNALIVQHIQANSTAVTHPRLKEEHHEIHAS